MKIALYVPSWPPGDAPNGIVTYAAQLVPALRRLGHQVFVVTHSRGRGNLDPDVVDLRTLAFAPVRPWQRAIFRFYPEDAIFYQASSVIASAVRELVEKHNIDVFEMEESFGYSSVVSQLKLLPVVVRLHGPWFLNGRFGDPTDATTVNRGRVQREKKGIQDAQFVTAPSAEVLQSVKDQYRLKLSASRVIPNPLDVAKDGEAWHVESCDGYSLLYVGRFDRRKGGDLVLRVFAKLAAACPKLTLKFVGPDSGIKAADNTVRSFEEYVRSHVPDTCRSRIHFFGQMKHSDVMALRVKCFATIIASQYETVGYTVLEAMALGCPLVTTAVGGIPEMIKDERNGLLVPSQDEPAMTAACRKLLDDRVLAARLGQQARVDCGEFYGADNIARVTVATYREAIDAFRAS